MSPSLLYRSFVALVAMLSLGSSTPLSAAIIASYDGSSGSAAADPTTQGWVASGNYSDPVPVLPQPGEETINGKAWKYWKLSNAGLGDKSDYSLLYTHNIDTKNFSNPGGWTATATVRIARAPSAYNGTFLQVSDGKNMWLLSFHNNADDGTAIKYRNNANQQILLSNSDIGSDYFTIQMYFDPATSSVSFFLNGLQIGDSVSRSDVATDASNRLYIRWGDNSSTANAVRTDSYWNTVQFETGYTVIPEPNTTAFVALGSLLAVGLLKFRR